MNVLNIVLHGPDDPNGKYGESDDTWLRINKATTLQTNDGGDFLASGGFSDEAIQYMESIFEGQSDGHFYAERFSRDTISNAVRSRQLVEESGLNPDKIRLITADYHMQRSAYLFRQAFSNAVELEEVPTEWLDHQTPAEALKLKTKEKILMKLSELVFMGIDMDNYGDQYRVLSRAQILFPGRYVKNFSCSNPRQAET